MARKYPLPWPYVVTLTWLRRENKHASGWYLDLCAMLAALAAGYGGCGHESASVWGRSLPSSLRHYGTPAHAGVILFWVTNGWGHVAWYIGKINGVHYVLCNDGSGGVSRIRMDYYRGLGDPFWVEPTKAIFRSAFGVNPYGEPAVTPKPAPVAPAPVKRPTVSVKKIAAAAKTSGEANGVSVIKHAYAKVGIPMSNFTDKAGPEFRRAELEWERRLGVAKPNGIPGRPALVALGNAAGFDVAA